MMKGTLATLMALVAASGASAQVIGGSDLVGPGELAMLEGWLGEGPLTIVNIWDHRAGDGKDSASFHAAADGKGRTFSVYRDTTGQVFGGYNPQSWESIGDYHYSYDPADRKAFLFNFGSGTKLDQGSGGEGVYQTYNYTYYGPTFGGGHDIYVDVASDSGYCFPYSYTPAPFSGPTIRGGGYEGFNTTDIEVFTIGVPAPGGLALLGLGALGAARRRR